ncbi:hypothetical protein ACFWUU_04105 [Kribbella sp. NPDC058693]|uniref:hypothetical protein n=1 Tax=Kribbella sp. NPDC058693 TaxID=3346602 RepID=UPI003663E6E2
MIATPKPRTGGPKLNIKLLIAGGVLFFIWPVIIALSSGHLFYCGLASAAGCTDAGNWQDSLALGPTVIGAFILSLAFFYNANVDRALKVGGVIAATAALSFLGYWLTFVLFWAEMWLRNTLVY